MLTLSPTLQMGSLPQYSRILARRVSSVVPKLLNHHLQLFWCTDPSHTEFDHDVSQGEPGQSLDALSACALARATASIARPCDGYFSRIPHIATARLPALRLAGECKPCRLPTIGDPRPASYSVDRNGRARVPPEDALVPPAATGV